MVGNFGGRGMAEYKIPGTKVVSPFPVNLTPGERRLIFALQRYFAPELILADVYFPRAGHDDVVSAADLQQIDVIAVDTSGIYVFESKDYNGYVYGHGDRRMWTHVLNFGKNKYQFYSPVLQNAQHVAAVRTLVRDLPIFSVIVFGRDATLKVLKDIPSGCYVCTQAGLGVTLRPLLQGTAITQPEMVARTLRAGQINPTGLIRSTHIDEVEQFSRHD